MRRHNCRTGVCRTGQYASVELRVLDVGFVTWDSETGPSLSLLDLPSTSVLLMTFVDVYGRLVSVRFDDAVADEVAGGTDVPRR